MSIQEATDRLHTGGEIVTLRIQKDNLWTGEAATAASSSGGTDADRLSKETLVLSFVTSLVSVDGLHTPHWCGIPRAASSKLCIAPVPIPLDNGI